MNNESLPLYNIKTVLPLYSNKPFEGFQSLSSLFINAPAEMRNLIYLASYLICVLSSIAKGPRLA